VTDRNREAAMPETFQQHASYGQVFWAVRDWLVTSAIGERVRVSRPYSEQLTAGRLEVASRLTSRASVVVGARVERGAPTGHLAKSLLVQLALKTVD